MELGGSDEGDDELVPFRTPLPPDDRIWRHPSELSWPEGAGARRTRATWPVAVIAGLSGAVLTVGLAWAVGLLTDEPGVREVVIREAVAPVSRTSGRDVPAVVAEAAMSVVRVEVGGSDPGVGSGVVIRDDGHVLTNSHVVDGARDITVVLADGRALAADVLGTDDETDLALLRIDAGHDELPVALLGSVDDLVVGEQAIAIGSPLGLDGPASVTTGVVSGLGREVESQDGLPLLDMIQTDAAIAPGSSGGALLDGRGVVVGITTAFAVTDAGAEGLGFATSIDVARAVAADLAEHGRARPPWLGVQGGDAADGATVREVMNGSPADEAGIRAGDVVIEVAGVEVPGMSALRIAVRRHRPDDTIAVLVRRGEEQLHLEVALAERPDR